MNSIARSRARREALKLKEAEKKAYAEHVEVETLDIILDGYVPSNKKWFGYKVDDTLWVEIWSSVEGGSCEYVTYCGTYVSSENIITELILFSQKTDDGVMYWTAHLMNNIATRTVYHVPFIFNISPIGSSHNLDVIAPQNSNLGYLFTANQKSPKLPIL